MFVNYLYLCEDVEEKVLVKHEQSFACYCNNATLSLDLHTYYY